MEDAEVVLTVPPGEASSDDARAFKQAMVLSNSETYLLLEKLAVTRDSGAPLNPLFAKSLEYTKRICILRNEHSVEQVRRLLLDDYHLTQYEAGQVMNLYPETEEEATTLLPSLKDEARFGENELLSMLSECITYKTYE